MNTCTREGLSFNNNNNVNGLSFITEYSNEDILTTISEAINNKLLKINNDMRTILESLERTNQNYKEVSQRPSNQIDDIQKRCDFMNDDIHFLGNDIEDVHHLTSKIYSEI